MKTGAPLPIKHLQLMEIYQMVHMSLKLKLRTVKAIGVNLLNISLPFVHHFGKRGGLEF